MTLLEFIESLSIQKQYELALNFCEKTLLLWKEYASASALTYINQDNGKLYTVPSDLLNRAFEILNQESQENEPNLGSLNMLKDEFHLPVLALQDGDWEPPKAIEIGFYAYKNFSDRLLGQKTTVFNEPQIFVVVNQTIEALMHANAISEKEIGQIFEQYANPA